MYSSAMNYLSGNHQNIANQRPDEDRMQQSHEQLYQGGGGDGGQQHTSESLGAGAAMQAFKMFQGGGGGGSGGSGGQSQMISMAMQEAGKLFDQQSGQGNVACEYSRPRFRTVKMN